MQGIYKSIIQESSGLYKEKGSKFLAFAFPVTTEDEIKKVLEILRKKYFDANHHCYAYRMGAYGDITRSNDDREPSGTAGKPILNQIISAELTNIIVVVVRYFGGTLLGASGLTKAYKEAARESINNAEVITNEIEINLLVSFHYDITSTIMNVIKKHNARILNQSFDNQCNLTIAINISKENAFKASLIEFSHLVSITNS